ncbi:glycosyltransferase family 2 protein [Microbulbifer sp. OS29]|uniref:Glycosyltransferase family 2 protein n=1 Tax=Microbulbifer okhotskensis TaxID=2926617 RepID=A0A9X2J948_9GAMM|nr:glycosyltransferase [Microbulbifer okhotskensis]MCO1336256.1 glycosyltransferase family 2 protein [Microbulbifer okhotskensis]
MWETMSNGITYLISQSYTSLFLMFWIVLILEIPRYLLSFFTSVFFLKTRADFDQDINSLGRVSVVIPGHDEAETIASCAASLQEQSYPPDEVIIVSDGSLDNTRNKIKKLQKNSHFYYAHATDLRGGRASAMNLGERFSTGEFIIALDPDSSLDRHAIKHIMQDFEDPKVGAVSGNIFIRNDTTNILTTFQAIEYLVSISLGKHALSMLDQVTCSSGAFSAFRNTALQEVGGFDAGGGEDLDITLRLRNYGWKIAFAQEAICLSDCPTDIPALTRQRFRWERDAIRLRYRKYLQFINPFKNRVNLKEFFHQFEFLLFNVIAALALPIYLIWLFMRYGTNAWFILVGAQVILIIMDTITFTLVPCIQL